MKCNKPYTVTSNNPKMSGSVQNKPYAGSYLFGGVIKKANAMVEQKTGQNPNLFKKKSGSVVDRVRTKAADQMMRSSLQPYMVRERKEPMQSYQKGGMVTKPRKMSAAEFTKDMPEDPRKPGAMMRNARREIMGKEERPKGPGTYTPQAWREREMEMSMPERELRKKSK